MREHVHYSGDTAELRAAVPPYQHVRSIGEDVSATELLLPEGHRLRATDVAAAAAAGATQLLVRRRPVVAILPTGDEVRPIGEQTGAGEIIDTNSLMLATQAREAGCEAHCLPIEPDDPARIGAAVSAAAAGLRPAHHRGGLERGPRRLHGPGGRRARDPGGARRRRPAGPPGRARGGRPHPGAGRARLPGVRGADLRHLRRAAAGRAGGRRPAPAPADHGPAGPQARLPARHGRLGAGAAGRGRRRHGRHPAAARRGRADLAGPRRRAAGRPGRARRATTRASTSRSSCCAASTRSSARSSPSARTTSSSTSPPPPCGRRTR